MKLKFACLSWTIKFVQLNVKSTVPFYFASVLFPLDNTLYTYVSKPQKSTACPDITKLFVTIHFTHLVSFFAILFNYWIIYCIITIIELFSIIEFNPEHLKILWPPWQEQEK